MASQLQTQRRRSTVTIIDPAEVERQRQLHSEALIASLTLNEHVPKIASLFNFQRMESDCDTIFENVARCAVNNESSDWKSKFLIIDWSAIQNSDDSSKLSDHIYDLFNLKLLNEDISQIMTTFKKDTGEFDHRGFLLQLFKNIEIQEKLKRSFTRAKLMNKFKTKARMLGVIQVKVIATANENALQHAMKKLVQGLRRKIDYNEDVSADSFKIGELSESDLRSELKRVLNINLTDLESHALFKVFDKDGNGNIDRHELTSMWYRVVADAKADKEDKKVVSRSQLKPLSNLAPQQPSFHVKNSSSQFTSPPTTTTMTNDLNLSVSSTTPLTQAMSKLTHAAKNGRQLLSLPDDMIPIDTARNLLKDCAGIRLTKPEMEALVVRITYGPNPLPVSHYFPTTKDTSRRPSAPLQSSSSPTLPALSPVQRTVATSVDPHSPASRRSSACSPAVLPPVKGDRNRRASLLIPCKSPSGSISKQTTFISPSNSSYQIDEREVVGALLQEDTVVVTAEGTSNTGGDGDVGRRSSISISASKAERRASSTSNVSKTRNASIASLSRRSSIETRRDSIVKGALDNPTGSSSSSVASQHPKPLLFLSGRDLKSFFEILL